jgi:hypothetical protein
MDCVAIWVNFSQTHLVTLFRIQSTSRTSAPSTTIEKVEAVHSCYDFKNISAENNLAKYLAFFDSRHCQFIQKMNRNNESQENRTLFPKLVKIAQNRLKYPKNWSKPQK